MSTIVLADLYLEECVLGHVGREFGGALTAAAPYTDEQTVAVWLLQYSADTGDMLDSEPEHDQIHRCLAHHVVFIQMSLYHLQRHTPV